jgi:hypothetical protein
MTWWLLALMVLGVLWVLTHLWLAIHPLAWRFLRPRLRRRLGARAVKTLQEKSLPEDFRPPPHQGPLFEAALRYELRTLEARWRQGILFTPAFETYPLLPLVLLTMWFSWATQIADWRFSLLYSLTFLPLFFSVIILSYAWRYNSDSKVFSQLASIYSKVMTESENWDEPQFKKTLSRGLEDVAQNIERHFREQLKSLGDRSTAEWLRREGARKANTVRELKKWVCMPTVDSRERLLERLSSDLIHLAHGDWAALPAVDGPTGPPLASRVLAAVRNLLLAALMLGGVWLLLQPWIPLDRALITFLAAPLTIVSAFFLVSAVDPDLSSLKQLKEIKDLTK